MSPLDYSLCSQTVTLYRKAGDTVQRRVVEGVYYSTSHRVGSEKTGAAGDRSCLLILPGAQDIAPGDRVYGGIGPEDPDWNRFVPALIPGLSQIAYVKPCCFEGRVCHTEAGRKQVNL